MKISPIFFSTFDFDYIGRDYIYFMEKLGWILIHTTAWRNDSGAVRGIFKYEEKNPFEEPCSFYDFKVKRDYYIKGGILPKFS